MGICLIRNINFEDKTTMKEHFAHSGAWGLAVIMIVVASWPVFVNEVVRSIMQPDGQVRRRRATLDRG